MRQDLIALGLVLFAPGIALAQGDPVQLTPPPAPPTAMPEVSAAPLLPGEISFAGNPFYVAGLAPLPPARPLYLTYGATAQPALNLSIEDREIIDRISAHHSAISSLVGRFTQIDQQGNQLDGVFYLQRPDKVRFRYSPPSSEEIISTGRGFYVIDRAARTRSVFAQDQVPLRQFLTDRIDLLSANLTDVVRTTETISISLADMTPIGEVRVTLIFEIATGNLRQWALIEPNGGQLTFSIFDTIEGVAIPARYFSIDPTLLDTNRNN